MMHQLKYFHIVRNDIESYFNPYTVEKTKEMLNKCILSLRIYTNMQMILLRFLSFFSVSCKKHELEFLLFFNIIYRSTSTSNG